jgi:hypothetical protein
MAGWSDDFSGIPDCGLAAPPRRFFRTERRRADLHPRWRLLTDVVPEALLEELGLQPSPDPGPGGTVKFVIYSIEGRGCQKSFSLVHFIISCATAVFSFIIIHYC